MKIQTAAEWREKNLAATVGATGQKSGGFSRIQTDKAGNTRKKSTGGKREDLGNIYFRSMWEANLARYLNHCIENRLVCLATDTRIAKWEFEPQEFALTRVNGGEYKQGARFYKPDFKVHVVESKFSREAYPAGYLWIEVKGYMDSESQTKLDRFARCYPDERLRLVMSNTMRKIKSLYEHRIPGWEYAE